MSFPHKIDRDAVADLQPYDTWLLQRLADGAEHVRSKRLRRHSFAWPYDKAPVVANYETGAYMLGLWRLSPHVSEITVTLRHQTTVASVFVDLAAVVSGGISSTTPTTEITTSASTQQTELTLDVTPYRHLDVVPIVLLVRSAESSTATISNTSADVDSWNTKFVAMDTASYTPLAPGGRYVLRVYDGSGSIGDEVYPDKRQLIYDDSGDWYFWPRLPITEVLSASSDWVGTTYDIEAIQLGQIKLFGFSIVESDSTAPPSLKPALRAGRPPSMLPIGQLYNRQREVFERQTRVFHFGPQCDPAKLDGSDLVQPWGNFVRYGFADEAAYIASDGRAAGGALVGNYDTSKLPDATVQTRTTMDVYGAIMVFTKEEGTFTFEPRLFLHSYDGGTGRYDADEVQANGEQGALRSWATTPTDSDLAHLWMAQRGNTGPEYHHLRGTIPVRYLRTSRARIRVFHAQITDDQSSADQRLLRLALRGNYQSREGRPTGNSDGQLFALLSFTVVGAEQVF